MRGTVSIPLPGDAEQAASSQAERGSPQDLAAASGDHILSSGSPKRTGHGADSTSFESVFHSPETLG